MVGLSSGNRAAGERLAAHQLACAAHHGRQQVNRLCGLIPIATEESAMSAISKPINSKQVSFSGQVFENQVLEDNELAAVPAAPWTI
jgi:hypothetical protein